MPKAGAASAATMSGQWCSPFAAAGSEAGGEDRHDVVAFIMPCEIDESPHGLRDADTVNDGDLVTIDHHFPHAVGAARRRRVPGAGSRRSSHQCGARRGAPAPDPCRAPAPENEPAVVARRCERRDTRAHVERKVEGEGNAPPRGRSSPSRAAARSSTALSSPGIPERRRGIQARWRHVRVTASSVTAHSAPREGSVQNSWRVTRGRNSGEGSAVHRGEARHGAPRAPR